MKVHELLSSEDKWTKKAFARDKDGEPISAKSPDATKWCLLGAIDICYPSERWKITYEFHNIMEESIMIFNDSHTYEEVMELVRRLDI